MRELVPVNFMTKLFLNGRILFFVFFNISGFNSVQADNKVMINIAYLTQQQKIPAALSNLDPFITDKGLQGAILGIKDNNTTGQFTGQEHVLKQIIVPLGADVTQAFKKLVADGNQFVVVNLPAKQLLQFAAMVEDSGSLLFDVSSRDDVLRQKQCHSNVFHILPSRAMRADTIAQYMLKKRWQNWFLVVGATNQDQLFAEAIKRSAKRFGSKIVAEKTWDHTHDARRSAQSEVPVFTQGIDYDVLVVADEQGLFGEYLSYRTWKPRPVVGTQGLVATSWHRTHEQWGAVQIQNRFKEQAGRWMEEEDYGAYLAIRAVGEAATRTQSGKMKIIKEYLLSDKLALQGYKGRALSFRVWNGQLRQPILLTAARSLVAVAPLEGFLHPKTDLDTLGFDQSETQCP